MEGKPKKCLRLEQSLNIHNVPQNSVFDLSSLPKKIPLESVDERHSLCL